MDRKQLRNEPQCVSAGVCYLGNNLIGPNLCWTAVGHTLNRKLLRFVNTRK